MGALLAGIGIKDYIYGGVILALIASFFFWLHEHDVKITNAALAPVTALANKAQTQVAVADAKAADTETKNATDYKAALAAPAPTPLGIVCHHEAAGSSDVPEAVGVIATRIGVPATDSGEGSGYDPSGAALQRAREADAQITYLQGRVHELETQMENSP